MRILYVFPRPDDESFGPARAIAAQVRAGHAATLTKGGAPKEGRRLGFVIETMGDVRHPLDGYISGDDRASESEFAGRLIGPLRSSRSRSPPIRDLYADLSQN
jgi:hypothetical protein